MNEQYQYMHELKASGGRQQLGVVASSTWLKDPKRLLFSLSRYKFTAKVLEGKKNVIEAGCGDGWCSKLLLDFVGRLTLSDYDSRFIADSEEFYASSSQVSHVTHDFALRPLPRNFDGFYCLDVLEHIPPEDEKQFISNAISSCSFDALFVFGMPTLDSQSIIPENKRDPGHINCKTKDGLRKSMTQYFSTVIMFSMNDEVVHTGHDSMSHYIFAVCSTPRFN
ncbi:methyltransferase domain protein [Synechococcus sp. A15-127]|uniref:class I SAM-dependent methyltransferase n=1 Tax=Synechococcus sp. A15-127 TaxID=1050624 RepID=UPI0016481499|nr:class I SAM-dependent methyltransferase [Synechococcus sp. A15-127]QNI95433.1 methyltransferase domain protein [Synechococcus sp. A15-127]